MPDALPRYHVTLKAMRTRAEVDEWLGTWRKGKGKRAPRLRPYECEYCHAWHVTHLNKFKPKKRTKGVSW